MGPTGTYRVVQIHPTRRCNLECRHCYSSSSPRAADSLSPEKLIPALGDLAQQGYRWASFSGGEPLVYPHLAGVLSQARAAGMRTGVVTNGILLTPRRLDAIASVTDLLVISLDGRPESHNQMRNSPKAFERMAGRLEDLRNRAVPFGFLFTLTQHNLDELPWVVEFAVNAGASALQVHPLDCFGNAARHLSGKNPDGTEGAYAWKLIEHLRERLRGRLELQLDLLHTEVLNRHPEQFFLTPPDHKSGQALAAELSPLVIEPDGRVVPLQYGFPSEYALGDLNRESIDDMVDRWRAHVGPRLQALAHRVRRGLDGNPGRFIDWYAHMAAEARRGTVTDRMARAHRPDQVLIPIAPEQRGRP